MPKPLELRKVKKTLKRYGIIYIARKGRHPKFYDPETHRSYPIKSHGKKTLILPAPWNAKPIPLGPYALEDLIKKFDLPADVFDK